MDEIFLCQGTPHCDNTYWTETVRQDGTVAMASLQEIKARAAGLCYPLMLYGHTRLPRVIQLNSGSIVVNPGSVGCPGYTDSQPVPHTVQTGSPLASIAVLEKQSGSLEVSIKSIAYDRTIAPSLARESADSDWYDALNSGWIDH